MTINDVYQFLKEANTYYLATVDENNQARVRPFGTIDLFEDKLYIQTGKVKPCFKQIEKNPFVEICAFMNDKWLRLSGKLVADERVEAKKHMLDNYPQLRSMYDELDNNTIVLYFESGKGTFEAFGAPKEEIEF